ncbi:MAG: SAM-dependent methyltransferase [Candidatus Hydrogenedentes bacterium]|nr:SAM-dependent methyltransferase [Candidatus Hydrogenedentota bacterium]
MASLDRTLRRQLENTVKQARRVAEAGARKAIESLAVHHHEPHSSMTSTQRTLRNRLRAHGRQLGDHRDERRGTQSIDRSVGECAYEHWHRMLFARFLAENDLLIEPEHGVPISLDDCRELAREQRRDWLELASAYAVRMLPQIFRPDDPVLEVNLPPETRSELEDLLKALPRDVFLADDSLGWVYQFWQAEQKDAVNKSEKKIGADELPAVTQLFTEDYMVEFLLHNTLGAWWAGKVLAANPDLAKTAKDEDELRAACAVGDITWTYLRFVREDGKPWRPAAGVFPHWPKTAAELRVLDPCCGSGHFLVFALPILVAMRMEEGNLSLRDACDAVLRVNLFGLELDSRCTQIAAFNLALAAWKATGYHSLPPLQIACSGLSVGASKEAWLKLAKGSPKAEGGLSRLYETFRQAPALGSLIEPRAGDVEAGLFEATYDELRPLLDEALANAGMNDEIREAGVAAQGLMDAVRLLATSYTLVITNVPFLGFREMAIRLVEFVSKFYPSEKGDLGYCLWARSLQFPSPGGSVAVITLQHWLSLKSYSRFRLRLLSENSLPLVAHLGTGAFETISGAKVNVTLSVTSTTGDGSESVMTLIDAANAASIEEKRAHLISAKGLQINQADQLANPDHVISFAITEANRRLSEYAKTLAGIMNGDSPRFIRNWWEICIESSDWVYLQSTGSASSPISGLHSAIFFDEKNGHLREEKDIRRIKLHNADERGNLVWGREGVAVSQMDAIFPTRYFGNKYDSNIATLVPNDPKQVSALWAYCASGELGAAVRAIDRKVNVTNATFGKVPFDLDYWQRVVTAQYPYGLPEPYSDDPTQWVFHGHPSGSVIWNELIKRLEIASMPRADTTVFQVAVARLLGYRWPAELDTEMRLSDESHTVMARCAELHRFADTDGIVCMSPIHKEPPAAQRLTELLAAAYGEHWSAARLNELLAAADCKGKTLDDWMRDKFFDQHCTLFHQRPFIWHMSDGMRDGFNALVNYHKLAAPNGEGRRTLEKLIYTYVGDWITQQRREQHAGAEGADARLAAAMHLQDELKKILEGEPPYDLFVRWKPLHEQPIGWDPDINDGVRLNIRPFMTARPLNARAKNACILRATPKIKWDKDRGKEPERPKDDYPWFWGWDEKTQDFVGKPGMKEPDGNRWNDLHYTNAFKRAARERKSQGTSS